MSHTVTVLQRFVHDAEACVNFNSAVCDVRSAGGRSYVTCLREGLLALGDCTATCPGGVQRRIGDGSFVQPLDDMCLAEGQNNTFYFVKGAPTRRSSEVVRVPQLARQILLISVPLAWFFVIFLLIE